MPPGPAAAPGEGGTAGALPRGMQSGTGLVPHCTLDFCSPRTNSCSKDLASTSRCPAGRSPCAGLDPFPFGAMKAGPRPCQVKDADLPRCLKSKILQGEREGWKAAPAGHARLVQRLAAAWMEGGTAKEEAMVAAAIRGPGFTGRDGSTHVAPQSSAGECVVPLKTSHATQLWLGKGINASCPAPGAQLAPSIRRGWCTHAVCPIHAMEMARCSHSGPEMGARHGQRREHLGFTAGFGPALPHRCCLPRSGRRWLRGELGAAVKGR